MFDPEEVLSQLTLKSYMTAAEFGCGSGGFTIPLAKRLREGKVYGLDILEEKLSALKHKAELEKVFNIQTKLTDLDEKEGSGLPSSSLDLVLIPNVLFQAEKKDNMIEEAARILKDGGELVVVDWKEDAAMGPKEGRISADEVKKMAEKLNLKLKKDFSAGPYHYGLVFEK